MCPHSLPAILCDSVEALRLPQADGMVLGEASRSGELETSTMHCSLAHKLCEMDGDAMSAGAGLKSGVRSPDITLTWC